MEKSVNTTGAAWFFVPEPRAAAKVRLFCFPCAGASPWEYRGWASALPRDVEVSTVCLPGRGARHREAPVVNMASLVKLLRDAIRPKLDKPYALFGHSLGALIAFELALALEKGGERAPMRLLVSGSPPPSARTPRTSHRLSDAELVETMRDLDGTPETVLNDPELLAIALPLLRADLELAGKYEPTFDAVQCPMTAFFGVEDSDVGREVAAGWRAHTRGNFALRGFPGGHFFVHSQASSVQSAVQREIL